MRQRAAMLAALCAASLAAATSAVAAGGSASSGPLSGTISASTNHPRVNVPWHFTVTAKLRGRPASGSASYQFLYKGALQRTAYPHNKRGFHFTGSFSDALKFPKIAKGYPLVMRVVISSGGYTVYVPISFQVV